VPPRASEPLIPAWNGYKVGITNSGNDARLATHTANGAELLEVVTVRTVRRLCGGGGGLST
jgi:hypothetical protein